MMCRRCGVLVGTLFLSVTFLFNFRFAAFLSFHLFHLPTYFRSIPISGQRMFLLHRKRYHFKDLHPVRIKQECSITETILRKWNTYSNLIKSAGSEIKIIHEVTALS